MRRGEVVELAAPGDLLALGGDELDDEDRADGRAAAHESIEETMARKAVDGAHALAELLAHR